MGASAGSDGAKRYDSAGTCWSHYVNYKQLITCTVSLRDKGEVTNIGSLAQAMEKQFAVLLWGYLHCKPNV